MPTFQFKRSNEIHREARRYFAGGTMGTRSPIYPEFPIYFARAKGCRMWDVDDNEFIDLLCSIGPVILGYAYDRVDEAAIATIRESFQSSTNHPNQVELAKLLVEMVPSAERVRFLKTGTEATVAAVRLARHITKRTYVARWGYHGWGEPWGNGEKR